MRQSVARSPEYAKNGPGKLCCGTEVEAMTTGALEVQVGPIAKSK